MTYKTFFIRYAVAALIGLYLTGSSEGQSNALNDELSKHFADHKIATVQILGRTLVFSADGDRQEIVLTPHDMRAGRFRAEVSGTLGIQSIERMPVNTFKGVTSDGGRSRVNFIAGRYEGYFERDGIRMFFEPASRFTTTNTDRYILYRAEDVRSDKHIGCGLSLAERTNEIENSTPEILNASITSLKRIELAVDADFEYVNTLGSVNAANAEILGILNTIEGFYETELGLTISIVYQHAWTSPDPYAAANAEFTVRNFQNHWNATAPFNAIQRDTAHLFSGKANVQSQGWAFIGVVCNNPGFAYGASGYINWAPGKYLITSHELAHNLGANHAEAPQGCADSIMNAQLSGTTPLTFCQFSRSEVTSHVSVNSCLTSPYACRFDFDGDNKADLSIFRPSVGEWWTLMSTNGANSAAQFGSSSDMIVPADHTGDGKADVAIFRPSNGNWFVLRSEDQTFYAFPFGANGDTPVPDDFDADGKADAAVFRPSTGMWFINRSSGGIDITSFGSVGDLPVNADYDGDGRSDIAIFRPATGHWWIQRSTAGTVVWQFGAASDRTVPGDYTGDGKADVAIYRPASGEWSILRSEDQSFYSFPFGAVGDIPASGDYDGDGKFDAAVFRPSINTWFAQRSTAGTMIQQFGANGDIPLPSAFVR
ncbi:MAG: VCBS repeat-containing protein [Blastocatellia bacterium]|nr:VCBS repeat-containing protein [Blastocatellia bacterium]